MTRLFSYSCLATSWVYTFGGVHRINASAAMTYIDPVSPGCKQDLFGRHPGEEGLEPPMTLQPEDELKVVTTKTVV